MGSSTDKEDRRRRRYWELLLLLLALLLSLICVFSSTWFALSLRPERLVSANMLPVSKADYGRLVGESTRRAPLDPRLLAEAATDAARLQQTPDAGDGTPSIIAALPPTPTATAASPPQPLPTSIPTATATLPPPTETTTRTPTSAAPTSTTTPQTTVTGTATPFVTATSSPTPIIPTPTHTPVPPTNTPVPPPPPTSVPPTDTPTPLPPPVVLAIAPNTQVNTSTVAVTITGQDFQVGCSVWLDGVGLGVSSCAPNTVLASVPLDMVAGYYDLTVTNPDAQFDTLTNAYTATNPIPVVTAITQSLSVSTITDLTVTITGNYFRDTGSPGNLRANLAEETPISLTNVTYVNSTTLTAEVPFASPGVPLGVYTLTVTNPGPTDPSGSLVEAFSVFTYTTVITCNGAVANCGEADGSPDGSWAEIDPGEEIIFDFGAANGITDGPGYDLVFFEHPNAPGIFLDFITIELSPDGSAWTPVLEWDGVGVTTNTNIDSYSTDAGGEEDNEVIDGADLLSGGLPLNTGVAMDIALLPPGAYRYVRITDPGGGTPEPAEVDALLRLH